MSALENPEIEEKLKLNIALCSLYLKWAFSEDVAVEYIQYSNVIWGILEGQERWWITKHSNEHNEDSTIYLTKKWKQQVEEILKIS